MKKITKLATIVLLAVIAAACDPGYEEYMVIHNASSHTVTVIPAPYDYYNSITDSIVTLTNDTYTLAPDEEVIIQEAGGIGAASFELGTCLFMEYYNDSVTLRFNGETGPQIVYFRDDTTGISPYNYHSKNYIYEEKRNKGLIFHNHRSYGKLTFFITDEHYDAAWGRAGR